MNQTIRTEFEKLISNLEIDSCASKEDNKTKYDEVLKLITDNIPKSLYKYRECDKKKINAFKNNKLYFPNASEFNDPFDSLPYIKDTVTNKELLKHILQEIESDIVIIDLQIKELKSVSILIWLFKREKDLRKLFIQKLKLLQLKTKLILNENKKKNYYSVFQKFHRNVFNIACLSEVNDSVMMHSHYSNNHKGFVLEYAVEDFLKYDNKSVLNKLFYLPLPVIYSNERIDFSEYVRNYIKNELLKTDEHSQNLIHLFKPLLFKQTEWAYEKEWRLIKLDAGKDNVTFDIDIKARKLYLSANISFKNTCKLVRIAQNQNIPVYKMKINNSSPKYSLDIEPFTEIITRFSYCKYVIKRKYNAFLNITYRKISTKFFNFTLAIFMSIKRDNAK